MDLHEVAFKVIRSECECLHEENEEYVVNILSVHRAWGDDEGDLAFVLKYSIPNQPELILLPSIRIS